MYVTKRNGYRQDVHFDKITVRISKLSYGLDVTRCLAVKVAQKVAAGIYNGVTTAELDDLAAETSAALASEHSDYGVLAARLAVSNLHKNTLKSFSALVLALHSHKQTGRNTPVVSDELLELATLHAALLDNEIRHDRDFDYDYFGFKTLERSYLLRLNGRVAERPQHMLMRVALGIHGHDVTSAIRTYRLMSERRFTHASPTLFNAGTPRAQMSSCFLLTMKDDSIEGIYDTLKECAIISKGAGGIGLSAHEIRASGSYISGTNGVSNGIVPMLRVFNDTARYVDQGGGKRKGAFAIYLEPWHADIFSFVELRKNHGTEETRTRDLFLGLWVNDLFMERVEANEDWSLFCPQEARGLADVWGAEFAALYATYERRGLARARVPARKLWSAILDSQIETGTPYMLYKDACNAKSNHQHLGTIKGSNLCCEIVEFSSPEETAVCNLASIALPSCVVSTLAEDPMCGSTLCSYRVFDFEALDSIVGTITRNLDNIIDRNYYPVETAKVSNLRHRPIGIGVQGLADVFILLGMPHDSADAAHLNRKIFERIYFAALRASCDLAREKGPHPSFEGSPVSRGNLQHDMWGVADSPDLDWAGLRVNIASHGVRNSLLVAPMPTASTSQILGNNEATEPYLSNIFVRRVLSGEFIVINRHLRYDLENMKLWDGARKNAIIAAGGSIANMDDLPPSLRAIYKTIWEIKQKVLVDMAADRGAFIDQSQSFNVFISRPDHTILTSLHFHAWRRGLKTGMYYLRTRPAADAIQFTVERQCSVNCSACSA